MGRPSKTYKITDRVGERVDPETLPVCNAHTDCFAWMEGRCTALNTRADTGNCGFFKTSEEAMAECRKCYQRLREQDRTDLITQYIKPLTALGLLDEEIAAAEKYGEQFDSFEKSNYLEQLEKAMNSVPVDAETEKEGGGSWNSQ
jgi:hypothetical protein